MKKYWHGENYKRFHKKRSERSWKKKLRFKNYRKTENQKKLFVSKKQRAIEHSIRSQASKFSPTAEIVHAPQTMCFLLKPEEMTSFIDKLESCEQRRIPVYVDLSAVERLKLNAITVLLSVMVRFKSSKVKFTGNLPINPTARSGLVESKFFEHLKVQFKRSKNYDLLGSTIYTHGKLKVDPEFSDQLIGDAATTVWGESRRCQGMQLAFVELMQNTNNHASSQQGEHHYWISLHHVQSENRVVFTFVDFGVGIFESLSAKKPGDKFYDILQKMWNTIGEDRTRMLRNIFNGKLHKTSTGKSFRGKGLPALHKAFRENKISKLAMVTNNVFYNSQDDTYVQLKKNFSGTMITWELNESNESKPRIY